jgi:hypothetical protein
VPERPPSLAHLSSEEASAALARHFGDFAKAAKELNINRSDLRKLTWHNPQILNAARERMDLFRSGVRSKIIGAIYSGSTKRRRWGYDAMFGASLAAKPVAVSRPCGGISSVMLGLPFVILAGFNSR